MRRLRQRHLELLERERGESPFRAGGDPRICLVYPAEYPVAHGNLGFHVVHRYLNELDGVSCERAVLPEARDLKRLERTREPPVSLETGTPLGEFDVLAFSITYELDYLSMVRLLVAAGIPPDRRRRTGFHPLVVVGGAAPTVNHEPLRPLVDGWFRGEAEGGRLEPWLEGIRAARERGLTGEELWECLGAGEGAEPAGARAFRILRIPGEAPVGFAPVGSSLVCPDSVFGDSALVEICRGCPWRCAFCVARDLHGAFRKAAPEAVLAYARRMQPHTDRLGIVGAGISAYPRLVELLRELRARGMRASLSSLRLDRVDAALLDEVVAHGQRTLTVAPESFSERLSPTLAKSLDLGKIVRGLERVGPERFERVKMYMIAGLPGEVEEDHEVAFATAEELVRRGALRREQLEFSYSLLLPRPGTALGNAPLITREDYRRTRRFLRRRARRAGVGLRLESLRMAWLCDLLCRGDRSVGELLLRWADQTGARRPLALDEGEYRRRMEPLLAGNPGWLRVP